MTVISTNVGNTLFYNKGGWHPFWRLLRVPRMSDDQERRRVCWAGDEPAQGRDEQQENRKPERRFDDDCD